MLVARANAKINLGLEIIGRRADGYHEVVTILQQIDLSDRLTFHKSATLTFTTDDASLDDESNLVLRAARLLRSEAKITGGVIITLEKRIPVAAGLGGGSADAAVTLLALNEIWELGMAVEELYPVAKTLGTDVAFFLTGGTQLATGRGDVITPLPIPDHWAVLALVRGTVSDKTRLLYGSLRPVDFSDGRRTQQVALDLTEGRGAAVDLVTSGFERATLERFPEVRHLFRALAEVGAKPILCGAGPTVMSLHTSSVDATNVARALTARGIGTLVVRPVERNSWRLEQ